MLPKKDELRKGDIVVPFTSYSNGYDIRNLKEAIVTKRYYNGAIMVRCIQGYIREGFSKEYEFTVNEKEFRLKTPKTISNYEIY